MDITSATVKLLELEHRAGGLRIDSYAVRPLREGAVVERRIRDKSEVVDTLGRAVDHARLQSRRAVVAVPNSAAITRTLSLPASLSDEDATSILNALYEAFPQLREDYAPIRSGSGEQFAEPSNTVPFHPAAIAFYKEKGMWTDANDAKEATFAK